MFRAGVQEEVRRALEHPISQTARQALGLEDVATLPEEEAKERLVAADAAVRPVPAQMDATHTRPC